MPLIEPLGPQRPPPADPADVARVRDWVRAALNLDPDVSVMVQQLACAEPGCPPIETVLGVLHAGGTVSRTLHKPVAEVARDDVAAAFAATGHAHS